MTPAIETRDLTRWYGATRGIEALDLTVEAGEVFGFLGPNGAGKTTTIRLLLDFIRPSRGEARVLGRSPRDAAVRVAIGHVPGELFIDGRMTGAAVLDFFAALTRAPVDHRRQLCERLELTPADLRRRVREYSRGMKQKLALVAAFQHEPALLILDEPTTGLDPLMREVLFELMREAAAGGATIFHSSHVLSEVERTCHRVAVLRQGRLAALMNVADARRTSARRMVIEFAHEVAPAALLMDGVALLESDGRRLVLRVTGDPNPLIRRLAQYDVVHLAFPESTLEEAFAAYYAADEGGS